MITPEKWKWFGQPGHFCCAYDCHWHLHTHVGDICISSVGEWIPLNEKSWSPLGGTGDSFYEVAVFPLDQGDMIPREMSMKRFRGNASATKWHMEMCYKAAMGKFNEEAKRIREEIKAESLES